MPVQLFYTAASATEFPTFHQGVGGVGAAGFMEGLYYIAANDMLVGLWGINYRWDLGVRQFIGNRFQLQKLWRDGNLVDLGDILPQAGFLNGLNGCVNPTMDGRIVRAPQFGGALSERLAGIIIDPASQGSSALEYTILTGTNPKTTAQLNRLQNYYVIDPLWPGNLILPGRVVDAQLMGRTQKGLINAADQVGYVLGVSNAATRMDVTSLAHDGGTSYTSTLVLGPITDQSYRQPQHIIPIDGSSVAIIFKQDTGKVQTDPSVIRVYDTQQVTGSWTLLWEDELPASDALATYDPVRGVLYSIGKAASNAFLNASRLKRKPMQIAVPTIVGTATELIPLTGQTISTLVLHGSGGVAGHTSFTSFYSLTDNDGSATITYFGPALPSSLTERLNATAAQVARV
jgi:hypothetical protein